MAEIRVNSTGGVKLFDADDSHYAQIKAGTISSNTDVLELGSGAVVAGTKVDLNGQELILDADADTSITADTDDQIDVRIAGADDFQFTANTFTAQSGSSIVVPDGGLTFGSTAISSTAAELNILDGVTSTTAELNILDGVTATASELNLLDGGTSVGSSITLADADGFVVNDGGTMKTIPASDINTYASGNLVKLAQSNSLTNTATINIDSVFSSVYTAYRFICTFKPVNSDVHCTFRWRDGGSDLTVSQYYGSCRGGYVNGSGAGAQSFSDWGSSSLKIADSLNNNNYNALHLDMLLYPYNNTGVANIGSIDNASVIVYQSHYWADGERQEQVSGGGTYTQTTVPDGFGFDLSGGDFDGYNYALFGYKG